MADTADAQPNPSNRKMVPELFEQLWSEDIVEKIDESYGDRTAKSLGDGLAKGAATIGMPLLPHSIFTRVT